MKRQFFGLVLLLSLAALGYGQAAGRAATLETNLKRHIEYLASDKLAGRRTGDAGALDAANYITKEFAKIGLKAPFTENGKRSYLQAFPYKQVTGYNVVGVLAGRDATLRSEAIVIGAHYDHLGKGGEGSLAANSTEIHHGADDNASGTAAIIELARSFAKDKNNKRTIIFIAFSGEEEGLFGSKHFVNNPTIPVENIVAMLNLDMIGRLHDNKLTIGGIGTATELRPLVEEANKNHLAALPGGTNDYRFSSFNLQLNEDGFGPSDHSAFYTKKIPVLFFFTGTHLDYHKPTDTADKINYAGEVSIVNFVAEIAKTIDANAKRPTYAVAKSSGTPGGRTGFNVSLGTIPGYSDSTDGMAIDGVRDDSPASRAGLKANDKIVSLAGKEVKNVQDYTKILGELVAGTEYDIVVMRGGERLNLKITPVKRQ